MAEPASHGPRGGLWPTRLQQLMLRAALLEGDDARAAFRSWRQEADLDAEFEVGTYRLLPLAYRNLDRLGVEDSFMGRLKGNYRLAWFKSQTLLRDLEPALRVFEQAGIRTMLLKGVPLALAHYAHPALRPMSDVDMLVPAQDARRAVALLRAQGWTIHPQGSEEALTFPHALPLIAPNGLEIDLHWHPLIESCDGSGDAAFWNGARPLRVGAVASLRPDSTMALLHAILHGVRWSEVPPIRWIADAMTVLRNPLEPIDWERFLAVAFALRAAHRLRLGCEYLRDEFAAPIPPATIARLAARPLTLIERLETVTILRNADELSRTPHGRLRMLFIDYLRAVKPPGPIGFVVGFTHYLRFRLRQRGRIEILREIARGLWRRVRTRLGLRVAR